MESTRAVKVFVQRKLSFFVNQSNKESQLKGAHPRHEDSMASQPLCVETIGDGFLVPRNQCLLDLSRQDWTPQTGSLRTNEDGIDKQIPTKGERVEHHGDPSSNTGNTKQPDGEDQSEDSSSFSSASPLQSTVRSTITDYEQIRLERITRNQQRFQSMFEGSVKFSTRHGETKPSPSNVNKRKRRQERTKHVESASRTYNLRGRADNHILTIDAANLVKEGLHGELEQNDLVRTTPLLMEGSRVTQYVCASGRPDGSGTIITGKKEPLLFPKLMLHETGLEYKSHLPKDIYDANESGGMILLAGKEGWCSIFAKHSAQVNAKLEHDSAKDALGSTDALLESFRLHKSWISNIQFQSAWVVKEGIETNRIPVLSASNDSTVCFWNFASKNKAAPEPEIVARWDHLHGQGIFSMHEKHCQVVTGSKDGCCVFSMMRDDGSLPIVQHYKEVHDGHVIKYVRWHSHERSTFASCGNDGYARLCDVRLTAMSGWHTKLKEPANSIMHDIQFHPRNEHVVLTSGTNPVMCLWDCRKTGEPYQMISGHCGGILRCSRISRPAFFPYGPSSSIKVYIAASGQKSNALTVFGEKNGKYEILTRGDTHRTFSTVLTTSIQGELYAISTRSLSVLRAVGYDE